MKLEAVSSAAKAYQGSVPSAANVQNTARASKTVDQSAAVKALQPSNASKTSYNANAYDSYEPRFVNASEQSKAADPFKTTDSESAQTAADDSRKVKLEEENQDADGKAAAFNADNKKDAAEDKGMQKGSKQLQEAVEKLQAKMSQHTEAVFGIHEGTNRVMIKIIDRETKDILKEYPPEKTLDMIQKVWEMAGILIDEKM